MIYWCGALLHISLSFDRNSLGRFWDIRYSKTAIMVHFQFVNNNIRTSIFEKMVKNTCLLLLLMYERDWQRLCIVIYKSLLILKRFIVSLWHMAILKTIITIFFTYVNRIPVSNNPACYILITINFQLWITPHHFAVSVIYLCLRLQCATL